MGHGRADQVVQFPWGETSYKFLKEKLEMPNVEFHAYAGACGSAFAPRLLLTAITQICLTRPTNKS
jgi:hypothetical protein